MGYKLCKISKLLTALAFGVVLLTVGKTNVKASSLPEDVGVRTINERTILENVDTASDISYQRTRSIHLSYGYSEISKEDYHRVVLLGTTQCHHACPDVYLSVFLDQMDPDTGEIANQIRQFDFHENDVYELTKSMSVIVPKEYYYSVRGYHSCLHDGVRETTTTMTNWVYIGITSKPVE